MCHLQLLELTEQSGFRLLCNRLTARKAYVPEGVQDNVVIRETDALATEVLELLGLAPASASAELNVPGFSRWKRR